MISCRRTCSIILILIFCLWEISVESGRVAHPKHVQSNARINSKRIYIDKELRQTKNDLETELFPVRAADESSTSHETIQAHHTAKQRETLDSGDINSSVNVECEYEDDSKKMDKKNGESQSEANLNDKLVLLNDHRKYKFLKRSKREPGSEGTPEGQPEAEPGAEPTGEPEGSHTGYTGVTEPTAEPEMSWPEPEPDWDQAFGKWQAAWPLHTYGFGVIFTIIALIPTLELLRMHVDKGKMSALKSSLLVIIFIFSSTRAMALFVDPYGSTKRFHLIVSQLLFSLGHPCIISALSLLLLVLIDTTKMNVAPPKFQRIQFIIPVVVFHVVLVIVTDFVVVYFLEAKVLLLVCQLYFLSLGFLLAAGYVRVGWKIHVNIKANVNSKSAVDNSMRRLQYLIAACAVVSGLISVLTIYGAAGVFGVYSDVQYVEPWPWWIFQSFNRLLETTICIVILLMNTKASSKRKIFPSARSFVTKSIFYVRRSTAKVPQTSPQEMTISNVE